MKQTAPAGVRPPTRALIDSGVGKAGDAVVTVREHLTEGEDDAAGPVMVEVELSSNSGFVDLTWLTPPEAAALGRAVVSASEQAAGLGDAEPAIRHPVWCRHFHEGDPRAGDPLGSPSFPDRLAPAEPDSEHEGREYRLDAGETFAFAVTVNATQDYDVLPEGVSLRSPQVRLAVQNMELVDAGSCVFLDLAEAETLIRMLQRAISDVRP